MLAVCLVAALAGCAGSKKSEPKPLRIVGLALYDFEADLAPASISNGLARVYPTRDELERRARGARLVHCAPRVCFGYGGWYAFDRGPELTGRDIVPSSVRSQFDQNSSPVVTMQFTPRGRREFLRVTRREALRGRSRAARHGGPADSFQHFAIVIGGELVSLPYIDFQHNPSGIPADNGVEIAGLGSKAEADRLVRKLRGG